LKIFENVETASKGNALMAFVLESDALVYARMASVGSCAIASESLRPQVE